MARVPTGIPAGICAIESKLSSPLRVLLSTGTPSTGRLVILAVIPGRCAAPPAPAMITLRPRSLAVFAYSKSLSGVLCADTILLSYFIFNSSRIRAAPSIVFQSDWEPIMIPTTGFPDDLLILTCPDTSRISLLVSTNKSCAGIDFLGF